MNTHERAGAFAIEIKIADMKLALRSLEFVLVRAIDRASETKLRVVRNPQSVVITIRFDYRQHWTKDFFLLDGCARLHIGNYGGLNEKALFSVRAAAAQYAASFGFSLFNVVI